MCVRACVRAWPSNSAVASACATAGSEGRAEVRSSAPGGRKDGWGGLCRAQTSTIRSFRLSDEVESQVKVQYSYTSHNTSTAASSFFIMGQSGAECKHRIQSKASSFSPSFPLSNRCSPLLCRSPHRCATTFHLEPCSVEEIVLSLPPPSMLQCLIPLLETPPPTPQVLSSAVSSSHTQAMLTVWDAQQSCRMSQRQSAPP